LLLPQLYSSRPVWNENTVERKTSGNEAFVLGNGVALRSTVNSISERAGWCERDWYAGDGSVLTVSGSGDKVGVLLQGSHVQRTRAPTESKRFPGWYTSGVRGRNGVLETSPANGVARFQVLTWSGSNRIETLRGRSHFGGGGFAYAPTRAHLLAVTGPSRSRH